MVEILGDSQTLDFFEKTVRDYMVQSLSAADNWWEACIPQEIRADTDARYQRAKKIDDVLNKQDYEITEYLNFDSYEKIILKRDNWKNYFECVFRDETIFRYKMHMLLSLRNDIRHGRKLNRVNQLRLRLHCYDVLSQIYEFYRRDKAEHDAMRAMLGLQ